MFLKTEIKRNLTSSANILLLLIVMLFGTSGFVKCQENKKSRQTHKLNQTSFSRNSAGKAKNFGTDITAPAG